MLMGLLMSICNCHIAEYWIYLGLYYERCFLNGVTGIFAALTSLGSSVEMSVSWTPKLCCIGACWGVLTQDKYSFAWKEKRFSPAMSGLLFPLRGGSSVLWVLLSGGEQGPERRVHEFPKPLLPLPW